MKYFILMTCLGCMLSSIVNAMPDEAEIEAWFNDDAEQRAVDVNEGQLHFLNRSEGPGLHKGINQIRLIPASLQDGWVELVQCHEQLDAVPLAEVIYPNYVLRKLKIIEASSIDKVSTQDATVQLQGIKSNARLCVGMEIQALEKHGGNYVLSNGPFQRRFLDGYYPMHIILEVNYVGSGLMPVQVWPEAQTGLQIDDKGGQLRLNAIFEGRLETRIEFRKL